MRVYILFPALLAAVLLCLSPVMARADKTAQPAAASMHTHLKIGADRTITVTQLFTNFPNSWHFYFRNAYTSSAPFSLDNDLLEVLTTQIDGKTVNLGLAGMDTDPHIHFYTREPGLHKYVLMYRTGKRILFEKEADKLVWGLWGGPVRHKLPVRVSASVELPQGGVFQTYSAHFGSETLASRKVLQKISSRGRAQFVGDGLMQPNEDFVLTVTWNKGVVIPDASADSAGAFNLAMGVAFCVVLVCCLLLWRVFGRDPAPRTAVPLFYPPVLRGRLLSPGAMDYLRSSAELTSKGFSALLLNLAAQKALAIFGSGTRNDPYVLTQTGEAGKEVNLKEGQSARALWNRLLEARAGFDKAERAVLNGLFSKKGLRLPGKVTDESLNRPNQDMGRSRPADGVAAADACGALQAADYRNRPCVVLNRAHSWELAMARDAAYMALADELRPLWKLRAPVVSFMHVLAWLCMSAVLGWFYLEHGTGASWAGALTILCVAGGLSYLWCRINARLHRVWMIWKEMGWLNLALYALYIALIPLALGYGFMDESFASFPGYGFMQAWADLRVLLVLGLALYLYRLTRQLRVVFISPLVALGLLCAIALPLGIVHYAAAMPGPGAVFLLLALLVPTLFAPFMKQPTRECAAILADIQGFALYLGAAEAPMHTVLNQPDKTPDEFRRGLPYAVALGLEKAWGARFAGLTGELRMQGGTVAVMAEYNHRMSGE